MKCYGAVLFLNNSMVEKAKVLGYKGDRGPFKVVCKAKSFAEANQKAKFYGLKFSKGYTSITGNKLEIEMCNKYDFIFLLEGLDGKTYLPINLLVDKEEQ